MPAEGGADDEICDRAGGVGGDVDVSGFDVLGERSRRQEADGVAVTTLEVLEEGEIVFRREVDVEKGSGAGGI